MKAVSIINYKGGVGKTTIAANIAAQLAYLGKRVMVIDLDPQTNLTFSFIRVEDWKLNYQDTKTIKFWFDSIIDGTKPIPSFSDLVVKKNKVDIISSHLGLIDVDAELATQLSSASDRQHRLNFIRTYSHIRQELKKLANDYDIVLFDCPPNFSIVTRNAIIASDYYIVPAKMDYLSTLGINQLKNHINSLIKQYNSYCIEPSQETVNPKFLGVVATMVAIRNGELINAHKDYASQLRRSNIDMFETYIRENKTLYADAPSYGKPIVLEKYASNQTHRNVVYELESLTSEFIKKVGA